MIESAPALGLITARGGSKGLPGKNIRLVGGKPLIVWSIEAAQQSRHLDRLILSSDDDAIMSVARSHGCDVPFRRDGALAGDTTPSIDVVLDALQRVEGYEWVVLLQPTSPLRTAADIDGAIDLCAQRRAPAVASVCLAEQSPFLMYFKKPDDSLSPVVENQFARRQDIPDVYVLNGAVYVANVAWLKSTRKFVTPETVAYVMPSERSTDIDDLADVAIVESIINEWKNLGTRR